MGDRRLSNTGSIAGCNEVLRNLRDFAFQIALLLAESSSISDASSDSEVEDAVEAFRGTPSSDYLGPNRGDGKLVGSNYSMSSRLDRSRCVCGNGDCCYKRAQDIHDMLHGTISEGSLFLRGLFGGKLSSKCISGVGQANDLLVSVQLDKFKALINNVCARKSGNSSYLLVNNGGEQASN